MGKIIASSSLEDGAGGGTTIDDASTRGEVFDVAASSSSYLLSNTSLGDEKPSMAATGVMGARRIRLRPRKSSTGGGALPASIGV